MILFLTIFVFARLLLRYQFFTGWSAHIQGQFQLLPLLHSGAYPTPLLNPHVSTLPCISHVIRGSLDGCLAQCKYTSEPMFMLQLLHSRAAALGFSCHQQRHRAPAPPSMFNAYHMSSGAPLGTAYLGAHAFEAQSSCCHLFIVGPSAQAPTTPEALPHVPNLPYHLTQHVFTHHMSLEAHLSTTYLGANALET